MIKKDLITYLAMNRDEASRNKNANTIRHPVYI